MQKTFLSIVAGLVGLLLAASSVAAEIVYSNFGPTRDGIQWAFQAPPRYNANTITLEGTEREVTEVTVGLWKQFIPLSGIDNTGTIDLTLRLYDVDSAGRPSSILYQSPTIDDLLIDNLSLPIDSQEFQVTFDVPNITVPDTFAVAAAISDRQTTRPVAFSNYGDPTIGTFESRWFSTTDGLNWTQVTTTEAWGLQVTVVPEPTTVALAGVAGVTLLRRRR
ncbi:MAG: PEP-CTERM sorting domain-containing protein [Planctomycetota bacterium]